MDKVCEQNMNAFLMLDKNERIPLRVTLHLLRCPECRSGVRLMTMAERVCAAPLKVSLPVSGESVREAVMRLGQGRRLEPRPVSMRKWVAGGVSMIVFMLFFNLLAKLIGFQSENLQLAFYLVFAALVTSYCMAFVGANMDFFIKKMTGDDNLRALPIPS